MSPGTRMLGGIGAGGGAVTEMISTYKTRVEDAGGSVIDEATLKTELQYIVNNDLQDKIGYWINKSFGYKAGTESVPECFVALSFDDGKSPATENTWQYLKDKGINKATFFINAKYVGTAGYVTWATLATMVAEGADIQCHSWSHAMNDVYGTLSDFTTITDDERISELVNSSSYFVANGLSSPIHFAYPRYVTNDDVIKLVAGYRKLQRGYDGDNYQSPQRYYGFVEHLAGAYSAGMTTPESNALAKSYVTVANNIHEPVHIAGHEPNETYFKDFIDHCISLGVDIVGVSEYYTRIDSYRDRHYSVIREDYEVLKHLDCGIKLDSDDGLIVFTDTYANIGAAVVSYFQTAGYKVLFWDDISNEALSLLFSNDKYHDEVSVTIDSSTDRVKLISHGFSNTSNVILSGDTPPGALSFDTRYYVRDVRNAPYWDFKLAATSGGTAINITSDGSNVKLSTFGFRDEMSIKYPDLNSLKKIVSTNYATGINNFISMNGCGCSGQLGDTGLQYFKLLGIQNGTRGSGIYINYCFFSGIIPPSISLQSYLGIFIAYNNAFTGGLDNLMKCRTLTDIQIAYNQIYEEIPQRVGDLGYLKYLYLYNNQLYGSIPMELGNCLLLERLRLQYNNLTGYEAGAISTGMTALIEVNLSYNAITDSDDIDQILSDLFACVTISGKTGTVNVSGGTNAIPSAAGLTTKGLLEAAGWTVNVNS